MNKVKALGTFQKKGDFIFRKEAILKWGNNDSPLGLVIMLNPGSSRLLNNHSWDSFINSENSTAEASGELILDDTMKAIVYILEQSFSNIEGELTIQNIFNLRDANSKTSISYYKYFFIKNKPNDLYKNFTSCINYEYSDILHSEFNDSYFKKFPWVWIAWTVEDGKFINARRRQILESIPKEKKVFAIYSRQKSHQSRRELYTYHPCPQNPKDRLDYIGKIVPKMKKYHKELM